MRTGGLGSGGRLGLISAGREGDGRARVSSRLEPKSVLCAATVMGMATTTPASATPRSEKAAR
jgi:hypothetical protein